MADTFPSGCKTIFYESTAPVGWTTSVSYNDATLRVVSGSSGGTITNSTNFSTFFSPSKTLDVATATNAAKNITAANADLPAHTHSASLYWAPSGLISFRASTSPGSVLGPASPSSSSTGTGPGPASHTHSVIPGGTFTTTSFHFGINYLNFIVAIKN